MNTTFRISYDDQPDEIVSKISAALREFNLTIEDNDGGDSFMDYKVVSLNTKSNEEVHDSLS